MYILTFFYQQCYCETRNNGHLPQRGAQRNCVWVMEGTEPGEFGTYMVLLF